MKTVNSKLHHLKSLKREPEQQAAYALSLLNQKSNRQVIQAALQILADARYPEARPTLLSLYTYYAEKGPLRDPGVYLRMYIIHGLRHIAKPVDLPIFTQAVTTYEFCPPDFKEEGALLRSAGLLGVNELDDEAASFRATRLLADGYTDQMSGEPALTAIRVLASQNELLPLYYYVMQRQEQALPDLISESLRSLTTLPAMLIPDIVKHCTDENVEQTHAMILVGLFDLLLNHETGPQKVAFLLDFLESTRRYDLYRYLVSTIIASGHAQVVEALMEAIRFEQNSEKVRILVEGFSVLAHMEEVELLLAKLRERVR